MRKYALPGAALAALIATAALGTLTNTTGTVTYPGAGSVGPFTVPFRFFAAGDLVVTRTTVSTGTTVVLTLTTDYTVSVGATTGTVTLTTALSSAYTLTIRRSVSLTQTTNLRTARTFNPKTHEDAFDRLAMQVQQVNDTLTGANLTSTFNSGASIISNGSTTGRTLAARFSDAIYVADYGAVGDGTTDDSTAIQGAITAATATKTVYFDAGRTYKMSSAVSITKAVTMVGAGSTLVVNGNTAFNLTAPADISGFTFSSSSTATSPDAAIYGNNTGVGGTRLHGNTFGRLTITLQDGTILDTTANVSGLWIENNSFNGDYTNVPYGSDLGNVLDLRGWNDVYVTGNRFNVVGQERFIKLSSSSRRVHITNNSFRSTGSTISRQAIDMFSDTREVVVSGNTFDLVGIPSVCVEQKTGDGGAYTSEPSEIIVSNNICKMTTTSANASPFAFYGSWGLASQTLARSTINISDNIVLHSATTTDALVIARGFTHAIIADNILWRSSTSTTFTQSIEASNNRQTTISGNQVEYGYIIVNGTASNPGGTTYLSQPERVLITGNSIRGWKSLGGVYLVNTTSTDVAISNNILVANPSSGSNGYVQLTNALISRLTIQGNTGSHDSSVDVYSSGTSTVSAWNMSGNSWQQGSVTWDPGLIGDASSNSTSTAVMGATVGDTVVLGIPYDHQGCQFAARVSAPNSVNIGIYNKTGAGKTFASGLWRISVSR